MEIAKDLVAASAIPIVLAILKDQASYGYAIIKHVKDLSENEMNWTEGMLYPILHRLEAQQCIESYWMESDTGRKRKYYRITAFGLEELSQQQSQWNVVNAALEKILKDKQP